MKNSTNYITITLFVITFLVHLAIWVLLCHLEPLLLVKFYLFLSVLFMMLITLVHLIHRLAPDFLGLSLLALIFLKFGAMYLIRNKLHFQEVNGYKFHFVIPYFVLTGLLTWYAVRMINYDKKQ